METKMVEPTPKCVSSLADFSLHSGSRTTMSSTKSEIGEMGAVASQIDQPANSAMHCVDSMPSLSAKNGTTGVQAHGLCPPQDMRHRNIFSMDKDRRNNYHNLAGRDQESQTRRSMRFDFEQFRVKYPPKKVMELSYRVQTETMLYPWAGVLADVVTGMCMLVNVSVSLNTLVECVRMFCLAFPDLMDNSLNSLSASCNFATINVYADLALRLGSNWLQSDALVFENVLLLLSPQLLSEVRSLLLLYSQFF